MTRIETTKATSSLKTRKERRADDKDEEREPECAGKRD